MRAMAGAGARVEWFRVEKWVRIARSGGVPSVPRRPAGRGNAPMYLSARFATPGVTRRALKRSLCLGILADLPALNFADPPGAGKASAWYEERNLPHQAPGEARRTCPEALLGVGSTKGCVFLAWACYWACWACTGVCVCVRGERVVVAGVCVCVSVLCVCGSQSLSLLRALRETSLKREG
jgi:hypothetical protein